MGSGRVGAFVFAIALALPLSAPVHAAGADTATKPESGPERPSTSGPGTAVPVVPQAPEPEAPRAEAPPPFPAAPGVRLETGESPPGVTTGATGGRGKARRVLSIFFGATLAGAALGTAAAITFRLLESKADNDYNGAKTQAEQDSLAKTARTYSALTIGSVVGTVVLAGGAVCTGLTLVFMGRDEQPARVALTPLVGPGLTGGAATFRF
jgi:hypothetical protein